jgi:hypothetical protein
MATMKTFVSKLLRPPQSALFFAIVGVLAVYAFFRADPEYLSVDKRVYTHYTVSLIEDFDFNLINQVPAKEAWLLTPSQNYPDIHSNGVAVLWAPFLWFGKWLGDRAEFTPEISYRTAQSLANVLWGLLALPLMWRVLRRRFFENVSLSALGLLLFCSPYFFYLVDQPENADMTSLFLIAAILNLYFDRDFYDERFFAFVFGLSFFFSAAIKFEAICDGLLFALYLIEIRHRGFRKVLSSVFFFAAGAALVFIPILINDSIKDGRLAYTHLSTFSPHTFLLWEFLFAPSGYLVTSPFFALLLVCFACLIVKALVKRRAGRAEFEYVFFLAIPIFKVVLASFDYNQNETYGARPWINSLPYFALALGYVLNEIKRPWSRIAFYLSCFACWLMALAAAVVYRHDFDSYFFTGKNWLGIIAEKRPELAAEFLSPRWLEAKLVFFPLLSLMLLLLAMGVGYCLRARDTRWIARSFVIGSVFYLIATIGNIAFNSESAKKTPPHRIAQAVIGDGPEVLSIFENVGCLERAIRYYRERNQPEVSHSRQLLLNQYIGIVAEQIVLDPVGFKKTLTPGKEHYLRPVLWND